MSRLLTVVNEREKLRSEYRMHLEQEYIRECKAQEQEELKAKNDEALERRVSLRRTEQAPSISWPTQIWFRERLWRPTTMRAGSTLPYYWDACSRAIQRR